MRNAAGVRGIVIVIQQQMPEEQLPVCAEQVQQSLPVYAASCAVNDVPNVSCVESFASRDKDLRGNELFRSQDPCRDPKDFLAARSLNTGGVNRDHAIAHPRDPINKQSLPPCFGQPPWIPDFLL